MQKWHRKVRNRQWGNRNRALFYALFEFFFAIKISEECLWSQYYSLEKIIDSIFLGWHNPWCWQMCGKRIGWWVYPSWSTNRSRPPAAETAAARLDVLPVNENVLGIVVAVLFHPFDKSLRRDENAFAFVIRACDHYENFLSFCHVCKFRKKFKIRFHAVFEMSF